MSLFGDLGDYIHISQVQLMDILSHRLASSSPAPSLADSSPAPPALVDKSALIFCSKKIAAVSGDARKGESAWAVDRGHAHVVDKGYLYYVYFFVRSKTL